MAVSGKQYIVLFFFTVVCTDVFSQIINVDKIDTSAYSKVKSWNLNLSIGIELDKQQTTLLDATNLMDVSLQVNRNLFIFSGGNRITNNADKNFLNTGYLHLRWRYNYKNQFHTEKFVQYQWDQQRGMERRFLYGVNFRYNFWHRKLWEMTFASGIMMEHERWNYVAVDSALLPVDTSPVNTNLLKSNSYVKWEGKTSANSNLAVFVFYQAAFEHFIKPRISNVINYDVAVSKHLGLGLHYTGQYDFRPVVPLNKLYYTFSTSFTYRL